MYITFRIPFFLRVLFLAALTAAPLQAGRYEQLRDKISDGPHLSIIGTTFYGGADNEILTGAAELADGRILAIGYSRPEGSDSQKEVTPFIQAFSAHLDKAHGAVTFPKGSARFTAAKLASDGQTLYVAGRRGPEFDQMRRFGGRTHGKGDHFVFALDTSTGRLHWRTRMDLRSDPGKIFTGPDGRIYVTSHQKGSAGIMGLMPDGTPVGDLHMATSNKGGFFGTDPSGRYLMFGTDRNTHTGREPWRQPHFYYVNIDSLGKDKPDIALRLWEWKPNVQIRGDGKDGAYQLESDSSIVDAAFSADYQTLFVTAWSDGGNSTMKKQPDDLDDAWSASRLGISTWGMRGANSISWLLRLDPETHKVKSGTQWVAFIPKGFDNGPGNWPNAALIDQITVLPNRGVAITGNAATGLVPTPNAFWLRPEDYPGKYGGRYVTVFTPDLDQLLFSSYLPGYEDSTLIPLSDGLLVVGTTKANDGREATLATPPVTPRSAQPRFGGGETDGHLIRLRVP
jgi:hypothetical protein